ncbi:MAG: hypothetical protein Q7J82_07050 [Coriobacteriia bacterium]|nr:hypothetical protein [Coriobacteriia bacterium]
MGRSGRTTVDPTTILEAAREFRTSADRLLAQVQTMYPGRIPPFATLAPGFALSAFSVELALKALILLESGQCRRGHDLGKLYKMVSPASQIVLAKEFTARCEQNPVLMQIRTDVIADGGDIPLTIESALDEVGSSFESWRYVYEGNLPSVYGLQEAFVAISTRMAELRSANNGGPVSESMRCPTAEQ